MPSSPDHLPQIAPARIVTDSIAIGKKRRYFLPLWVYLLIVLILLPITILAYQLWQTPEFIAANQPIPATPPREELTTKNPPPYNCRERPAKLGTCFNHLPYAEAPQSDLRVIDVASDGYPIQLRSSAAVKFQEMQTAARQDGVNLYAISGFRSIALQERLFYDIARQRGQDLATRARVSAPPGYSEHHTGYAVDIGDRDNPSTELNIAFERTRAFQWLSRNAGSFGFELSFPKQEPQGISYEPWHWRFVGDAESRRVFRK